VAVDSTGHSKTVLATTPNNSKSDLGFQESGSTGSQPYTQPLAHVINHRRSPEAAPPRIDRRRRARRPVGRSVESDHATSEAPTQLPDFFFSFYLILTILPFA
jgi:hypothetical protein